MVLTGKAREDFLKYASYTFGEDKEDLNFRFTIYVDALIIEWFDSVGIYICITPMFLLKTVHFSYSIDLDAIFTLFDTRKEATKQAIIIANEKYNKNLQINGK